LKYSIGFIPIIITCFSIYSLSSNSYGQNLIDPSQFLTPSEVEKPIVSISTNKFQYLPGETIIISGSAFNTTGAVNSIITLGVLYGEDSSVLTPDNKAFTGNLTYKTDIRVINGSFSFSSYSNQKEGYYTIVAAFKEQTSGPTLQASELPFAQVRVVNPIFTVPYWMLLFAIACFILLIIVILRSGRLDFATGEILRFVLITGIVASPIVALLFSDSELGINSPISLILKPDVSKDQDALDAIWKNQWFIAVGGMKIDNYMSGILIPFYVIVFGLAGGYLRYLYSTSIKLWNLERSSDATTNNVKIPLFNWNKVPDDQAELIKFKSFLINSFGANWIKEGSIRRENDKIISSSKDQLETITIEAIPSENIAIIKLGDVTYGKLRLEKKQNGDLNVYHIIERRVWSFYQSLTDLALLLLSPLLAIAAWFLLTRAGDVDKFIVALVSLTVGLATNTIISYLTDFTTGQIRTQATGPST
jgi:hypothetical protein